MPHIEDSQHPGIRAQLVNAASQISETHCTGQCAPRRPGRTVRRTQGYP